MSDKLPNRKKIRFENYDYSDFGVYYITVCTKDKQKIFWTNKTFSAYKVLGDAGISVGVVLQPPPVAEKGSKALSEITSNRQCIYAQRIATIFQTGERGSPLHCIVEKVTILCSGIICVKSHRFYNRYDWRSLTAATNYTQFSSHQKLCE